MEPGIRSDRTGMALMRRWEYNQILGYHSVEILDNETRRLIGDENFRKIDIETCKPYYQIKMNNINEKYIFHSNQIQIT